MSLLAHIRCVDHDLVGSVAVSRKGNGKTRDSVAEYCEMQPDHIEAED